MGKEGPSSAELSRRAIERARIRREKAKTSITASKGNGPESRKVINKIRTSKKKK